MPDNPGRLTRQEAVTLKEYIDTRIAAVDKAQEIFQAQNRDRLSSMNEIREQLRAQAATFITRIEWDAHCQRVAIEMQQLRDFMKQMEGKASQQAVNTALLFAVLGAVLGVIGLALQLIGR